MFLQMQLPFDIWTMIAKYCNFETKKTLRSLCSGIRKRIVITEIPRSFHNLNERIVEFYPKLTTLYIEKTPYITEETLIRLTNLTRLTVSNCPNISDASIATLTKLTYLKTDKNISHETACGLTNLTDLFMGERFNTTITDASIARLTNLVMSSKKFV